MEYAETLRRLEEACLTPIIPLTTERIKAIRERERVSQAVFVNNLNVTRSLMSKGNRGERVWRSTDWRLWRSSIGLVSRFCCARGVSGHRFNRGSQRKTEIGKRTLWSPASQSHKH